MSTSWRICRSVCPPGMLRSTTVVLPSARPPPVSAASRAGCAWSASREGKNVEPVCSDRPSSNQPPLRPVLGSPQTLSSCHCCGDASAAPSRRPWPHAGAAWNSPAAEPPRGRARHPDAPGRACRESRPDSPADGSPSPGSAACAGNSSGGSLLKLRAGPLPTPDPCAASSLLSMPAALLSSRLSVFCRSAVPPSSQGSSSSVSNSRNVFLTTAHGNLLGVVLEPEPG
mmetsp:Transcript_90033/g.241467  ORF Transcript_90033/g.241467 Transcript_90033/m.241467 type:complete len:228 (-) Transcript_90033:126-809(-)